MKKLATGRYQVRWRDKNGKQRAKNFRVKELAQAHLRKLDRGEIESGPRETVGELIEQYKASAAWKLLDYPTQITYSRTFERWFDLIEDVALAQLTPQRVSQWIVDLKANIDRFGRSKQRKSFTKEFFVMKSLLAWYCGYKDDGSFVSPIRKRHEEEMWIDSAHVSAGDNFEEQVSDEIPLTEDEFVRFIAELRKSKFGDRLAVLADVQYDHVLRISEAAAVMWSDIRWDKGEIKFQRHVQYVHQKNSEFPDRIVPGLKNRKAVKRRGKRFERRQSLSKTNPFFPRSTAGLKKLFLQAEDKKGLVFVNPETGDFFTYKCIKDKYDRAFKRAGLTYKGTHIVRYGGVNTFLDKYDTDASAGMELLGNESEGRYILRRPSKVSRAVKSKEPSASNVHSAPSTSKTVGENGALEMNGGMDGTPESLSTAS